MPAAQDEHWAKDSRLPNISELGATGRIGLQHRVGDDWMFLISTASKYVGSSNLGIGSFLLTSPPDFPPSLIRIRPMERRTDVTDMVYGRADYWGAAGGGGCVDDFTRVRPPAPQCLRSAFPRHLPVPVAEPQKPASRSTRSNGRGRRLGMRQSWVTSTCMTAALGGFIHDQRWNRSVHRGPYSGPRRSPVNDAV